VGDGGRMSYLTFDTGCRDSCCYCMTTIGGVMGSGQSASVSDSASSTHRQSTRCGYTHCSKVYIDKQHTRSIWCLQLTHSDTSTLLDYCWFSSSMTAPVSQAEIIQFLNVLGGRCRPLCSPSPTPHNLLLRGRRQASKRQLLLTYRHSPPY